LAAKEQKDSSAAKPQPNFPHGHEEKQVLNKPI
jgi:hypothetical protein